MFTNGIDSFETLPPSVLVVATDRRTRYKMSFCNQIGKDDLNRTDKPPAVGSPRRSLTEILDGAPRAAAPRRTAPFYALFLSVLSVLGIGCTIDCVTRVTCSTPDMVFGLLNIEIRNMSLCVSTILIAPSLGCKLANVLSSVRFSNRYLLNHNIVTVKLL